MGLGQVSLNWESLRRPTSRLVDGYLSKIIKIVTSINPKPNVKWTVSPS